MENDPLTQAILALAGATHTFSDADLGQPWRWRAHDEGARFALLGTYHELCELGVALAQRRAEEGPPLTLAQRALAPYHAAYRDLQATLLGVDPVTYDTQPGPGQWSLRYTVGHIIEAERTFFALVHYGRARHAAGDEQVRAFPQAEVDRLTGDSETVEELLLAGEMATLLAFYDDLHRRILAEFATLSAAELQAPSLWWEGDPVSLQYRLHRFDAHLRQHAVQAETIRASLAGPPGEAQRLLRLVYQALAAVENATLGAPDFGLAARQELAETVARRTDAVTRAVTTARELAAAVRAGDAAQVKALLAAHPQLAEAHNQDELPLVMDALYRRQEEIVAVLVGAGAGQDIFAAAALGNQEEVEALLARWDGYANLMARDGFTPLQLACYFGHEEVAHSLIDHGADVNAVAANEQQIQPLHAAAACGSVALVRLLLAHGADPNGRQQGGHVPLHTAAANGDAAMVTALLEYGADTTAQSVAGETPLDQARKDGHETVVVLLRERAEGDAGAIATE